MLKSAGFVFVTSTRHRDSISTYYRYPGRSGLLRVSDHRSSIRSKNGKKKQINRETIVAKITFSGSGIVGLPGRMKGSNARFTTLVDIAIGQYMRLSDVETIQNTDKEDRRPEVSAMA